LIVDYLGNNQQGYFSQLQKDTQAIYLHNYV